MEIILIVVLFALNTLVFWLLGEVMAKQKVDREWFKQYSNGNRSDKNEINRKINLMNLNLVARAVEETNKES